MRVNGAQFAGSAAKICRRLKRAIVSPFPAVSRQEWRFPALVGIVALASTLPGIVIGYLTAPSGTKYAGFFDTSAGDSLTYLAAMKEGAQGHWLWHDLYTSEPHSGSVVYPFYLLLGHLQRLTHLPPVLVFQTARVLLGFALVVLVYGFCSLFFSRRGPRRIAYLLAVFGGGISPLLLGAGLLGRSVSPGLDVAIQGTGVYSTLLAPPHLAIAAIGLLTVFGVAVPRDRSRPHASLALAAVAGVVCALVYPQLPLFAACVLLAFAVWERRLWPIKVALAVGLAAAPYVCYAVYLRLAHPVVSLWVGTEGAFPVGNPLTYLLVAHTVPAVAFIVAVATRCIRLPRKAMLPVLWVTVAGIFAFAPIGVVVLTRVLYIVSVPFGIVGCWGLLGLGRLVARPAIRRRLVTYGVLVAGLVSVFEFAIAVGAPLHQADPAGANYVPTDLYNAMVELEQRPPGLVMNLYSSGQFVPPFSGHGTFVGNEGQTLDVVAKQRDAVAFFGMDDPRRSQFMHGHNISYVLVGPAERRVSDGAGNPVRDSGTFRLLFAVGDVQMYELRV